MREVKNNMEYKKKMKYSDKAKKAEACCKLAYPAGYYKMGMSEDDYTKIMKNKPKKVNEYHDMNGCKMKGAKHQGPEGYWGI